VRGGWRTSLPPASPDGKTDGPCKPPSWTAHHRVNKKGPQWIFDVRLVGRAFSLFEESEMNAVTVVVVVLLVAWAMQGFTFELEL
jgi:hypothetical protein